MGLQWGFNGLIMDNSVENSVGNSVVIECGE